MDYPYLYAYATGRDDGFTIAVGIVESDGARPNGSLALFQTAGDAALFGRAYANAQGGSYADLPSALNSALQH